MTPRHAMTYRDVMTCRDARQLAVTGLVAHAAMCALVRDMCHVRFLVRGRGDCLAARDSVTYKSFVSEIQTLQILPRISLTLRLLVADWLAPALDTSKLQGLVA